MSKKKPEGWETLWEEYLESINKWKHVYEMWTKAGNEAMVKYSEIWQKTLGGDAELLKNIGEKWQEAWKQAGVEQIKQLGTMWETMSKISGMESIVKFNEDWLKMWQGSDMEPFKAYSEMLKKYTETWENMWKK